jgi:methionine salvage enolase-phosphatase E1
LALNKVEEVEFLKKVDKIKSKQEKEQILQMVTSWVEQGEERTALKMFQRVLFRRIGVIEPEVDQRL